MVRFIAKTTVGQKFWMSITGLFLIIFLAVHLTANLMIVFDDTGELYNEVVHFMGTNPIIRIMEPILALGFIIHIILATILTLRNQGMRPVNYNVHKLGHTSSWASRNMFILGLTILAFLTLHIINFWVKLKFGGVGTVTIDGVEMEDGYTMVATLFSMPIYSIIYIIAVLGLAYHISHGFWSAFQTIGWSNEKWRRILTGCAYCYAVIIAVGFSIIPIYFLIK